MRIGILGGTGPAGRGLAVRLAAAGRSVVIGSRDAERAASVAKGLVEAWPDHPLSIVGASNEDTALCDLVVVATPWEATLTTVGALRSELAGKVVVSMVVALAKEGREFLSLGVPRGSMAGSIQARLADSLVVGALHHLPASEMEKLTTPMHSDVLVCSDHPSATRAAIELVEDVEGLRAVDAGSLAQAAGIESFTAVLITVNIRHKVHAALQLTGYGDA